VSRRRIVLTLVGMSVLAITACTSTSGGAGPPPSAAVPSSPSNSVSASSPAIQPVLDLVHWRLVRSWTRDEKDSFGAYGGGLLLLQAPPVGGPAYSSVVRKNGSLVLRHFAGPGHWQTQNGWLWRNRAVFLDLNYPKRLVRLSIYSTKSGSILDWPPSHAQVPQIPDADVAGGQLGYLTGLPDEGGICFRVVDLTNLETRKLQCAPADVTLGDVALHDGIAVISRLVHPLAPKQRCKTLEVIDLASGHHDAAVEHDIADHAHCLAWDGVAVGDALAWDQADPNSEMIQFGHGFVRTADGTIQPLGTLLTDTMVPCGDALYWLTGRHDQSQVERWTPDGKIAIVYRTGPNRLATLPQCANNRWLTTRVDSATGHNERLRLITLDVRSD
jgi:hypothetical protein